jgi:signal transduction histidine kinase
MRLKTKLVLAAAGVTFGVVILLSVLFLGELLREGIAQTVAANNVLADEVRSATRQALEKGLAEDPPADRSSDAFQSAVIDALRRDEALKSLMDSIVRYSLTVQDVSVTDVHGLTLASTDPDALNQSVSYRTSLTRVSSGNVIYQMREVFARTQVFDVAAPLDRNGQPFLVVHVGLRSTFLRATYLPGLSAAGLFSVLAAVALVAAAGLLTNVALRPLETINAQLELLTGGAEDDSSRLRLSMEDRPDTVVRVAETIDRLERTMRSKEAGYTALKTNLDQMLDTLRDGVLLFAADRATGDLRAVMVSDAVEHFLAGPEAGEAPAEMIGQRVEEIFAPDSMLGNAVLTAFGRAGNVAPEVVTLEDGRQVQIALDRIQDGQGTGIPMGTLLTLRDMGSALELEQELEVSRRLAAIGRITASVGHEVKNPINAMVLHLELLRGKLAMTGQESEGAQRHVEILTSEMQRLDRVVQTLADFSRPMEMRLRVVDLHDLVASVIDLTWAQMREHKVTVRAEATREPLMVHVDSDLIRQALLNLVLNGMQAMEDGGVVTITLRREQNLAVVEVSDEGTGIPAELLPRIFELYFTTKKTGSGIGLAMTYRILQMHGGALDVRSSADTESKDHGSVFTLRLPISMLSSTMRGDTKNLAGMKDRGERA